ncbi:MAG: hypothetical protein R3A79_23110 [Nannocystaceae bacterium]
MLGSARLAFAAALVGAVACAPPITCPDGQEAYRRDELLCPPCSEDHPCPCQRDRSWLCRPTAATTDARRREAEAAQARRLAAIEAEARAEALAAARLRMLEANGARASAALAARARGEPHPSCGLGGYLLLEETGVNHAGDGILTAESCARLPAPVASQAAPSPVEAADPVVADKEAAVVAAAALCAAARPRRCGDAPRRGYFACKAADGTVPDYGPGFRCPAPEFVVDTVCATEYVPALEACPKAGCRAKDEECCREDGTIVRPCWQTGAPGCDAPATCRSAGGWCRRCR